MTAIEGITRFLERRPEVEGNYRHPGVVVLEFGGGACNYAGTPSCKDICAVPSGTHYDSNLDPSVEMLSTLFHQVALLKPAIISIVPNGEAVDTIHKSNTNWSEVTKLREQKQLTSKQWKGLQKYQGVEHKNGAMTPAEKLALTIALGSNSGLNISLTSNGSFLTEELLKLYSQMGLQMVNLSYHPNNASFNPSQHVQDQKRLEHLIDLANKAIKVDVIPTITHVLTSKNADTFVALADYITERDIFFDVGIADGKGRSFSADNLSIEPTDDQLKKVFRMLLARKLFADHPIRAPYPYLLFAPYLRKWVCSQSTDFFHISVQQVDGVLQPNLNPCSEVRPNEGVQLGEFLKGGELDVEDYLIWRSQITQDPQAGCPTCISQCYFGANTRSGVDVRKPLDFWDAWDTAGKGLRQIHTFRHPIRPTVSHKGDFQNPYLWESLLQTVARQMAGLAHDAFWQDTFKRSYSDKNFNFDQIINTCTQEALDPTIVAQLIEEEQKNCELASINEWHEASNFLSRIFHYSYLRLQESGKKAALAIPLKFADVLKHESKDDFELTVANIKTTGSVVIDKKEGHIYPFIRLAYLVKKLLNIAFAKTFGFKLINSAIV